MMENRIGYGQELGGCISDKKGQSHSNTNELILEGIPALVIIWHRPPVVTPQRSRRLSGERGVKAESTLKRPNILNAITLSDRPFVIISTHLRFFLILFNRSSSKNDIIFAICLSMSFTLTMV